jgi:phytoene dehydrogenase-like protein
MKRAEKIIPNLSECVKVKEIATPQTLYKYTLNREGAVYGWASVISQSDENISYKTPIKNLFLSGQWVSFFGAQGGVSMVALVGRNVARSILKSWRK